VNRSVWKRLPGAVSAAGGCVCVLGVMGCGGDVAGPPPVAPTVARAPADPSPRRALAPVERQAPEPEVSWETQKDQSFARFLQTHSAGMIHDAAVGIERGGRFRVKLSSAAAPEDALPLTKSLLAGARKDFPDKPIILSVFDPSGQPILKARYRPNEGVKYKIAHSDKEIAEDAAPASAAPVSTPPAEDALSRGGVTARDQKFAAWAEGHGKPLLRFVESDLERHGRLWVGITREVKPEEVKPLTRSLLEGARKEFPDGGELVATVFDPDGEKIGKAHMAGGGDVRWEQ